MSMARQRPILWTPAPERAAASSMARFMAWLREARGLDFPDYDALWQWSVSDLDAFWAAIRDWSGIRFSAPERAVLAERRMPGAVWFPGARLNYAENLLRQAARTPDRPALILHSETFGRREVSWAALAAQVASVAARLRAMGVGQGDRVAAILPNTETAAIAMLATASIGAIWSLCAPEMGHVAILDRFRQIEPKVLIAQDGYVHAGRSIDRRAAIDTIAAGLPTLAHRVVVPVAGAVPPGAVAWETLTGDDAAPDYAQLPFDHPLWVVYSSGTTGNPKPIVHGHGGILIEACKMALHLDVGPQDRFCWLTSSGWIMWNAQFTALGQGATLVLFDAAPNHPDMLQLWRVASRERVSYLGVGAAFLTQCIKAGIRPREAVDLAALRSLGTTGSPLTADGYAWVYDAVKPDIWLAPVSGGTDLASAFVGGNPLAPVRAGEMQCRYLGAAIHAFDEAGRPVTGEMGELVCTEPLPSMPLFFWGDEGGRRLRESYFDRWPGVWRHGDWVEITPEGGVIIYGRSDATINRRGLRLGSSEIYKAVESLPEVTDSLVVDLEFLGRDSFMPLFVVLAAGLRLDAALQARIRDAIREAVSARFLPDEIVQVREIPRTLSGKKLEIPVKKLLLGEDPARVVNRDSMANPDSFDIFIAYARARAAGGNGKRGRG